MNGGSPASSVSGPEEDPHPVVALPRPGLSGAVIAGVAALLALSLFLMLDARRRDGSGMIRAARGSGDAFASPPPLTVPHEPAPVVAAPLRLPITINKTAPSPMPVPQQASPSMPPPVILSPQPLVGRTIASEDRRSSDGAPALVFDAGTEQAKGAQGAAGVTPPSRSGAPGGSSAQRAAADDTPARASVIGNKATTMPTGTLIPAVLETPIDTARPGLVRALVSEDARGFDGSRVLVPRGSRLIGEYQADVRSGQNRVLVTWARLIRPDGVTIRLGSPASDPLGGAGVPGRVNTFFFQRFAAAVLQSALTVGVNLASRPGDGSVIVGLPTGQLNNTVGQGLIPNDLRPKITVRQGAALNVFVARDLDFAGVPTRP